MIIRPAVLQKGEKRIRVRKVDVRKSMFNEKISRHKHSCRRILLDPILTLFHLLKMFTGDFSLGSKVLVDVHDHGGDDAEKQSESEHNSVPNPSREGGLSLREKGFGSRILKEGRDDVV